jgi:hypothetical protein
MKTIVLLIVTALAAAGQASAQQITAPGVKWSESYTFDRCNQMKVEFYASGNELMRTLNYKTWFSSTGMESQTTPEGLKVPKSSFAVMMDAPGKGGDIETIFDMGNEVAIQVYSSDSPEPMYNAGRFKYPVGEEIKKLELVPSEETRTIGGHLCKKYTYAFKKITGSVWITGEVTLPNDYGIFRAAKMAALHNTLSAEGFVMEMTSEDARGGKTIMTTVSLGNSENHTVTLPKGKVGTAINKVNYFTY